MYFSTLTTLYPFGQDANCVNLHGFKVAIKQRGHFMSIQSEDVQKIAHLARLGVDQDQVESYAADLSDIMGMVEQMNQVDTTGIEPMAHPLDQVQRLRSDRVTETDQRELLQKNSAHVEDGLFLVPRVID